MSKKSKWRPGKWEWLARYADELLLWSLCQKTVLILLMSWTGQFTDNCLSHVLLLVTWIPNRSCSPSLPLPASTLPLGFSFPWRVALSHSFSYFSVTSLFVSAPPPFYISVGVSCEKAQPRTSDVLLLSLTPCTSSMLFLHCWNEQFHHQSLVAL